MTGRHTFRCRDNGYSCTAQWTRHLLITRISAQTWPTDSTDPLNDTVTAVRILQIDLDHRPSLFAHETEILNVALLFKDPDNISFQPRRWNFQFLVPFLGRVPYSRQQ